MIQAETILEGAFFESDSHNGTFGTNATTGRSTICLDASRCSSIYGNAQTVQPASLTAIYAIKY